MDWLWNTVNPSHNIVNLLNGRQRREDVGKRLTQHCQFTAELLQRLRLEYSLEGHQGCVNCLQWSADGRTLASGSDDTHVRIWNPFVNKCVNFVATKHIGNIFSVKFVGDGSLIATGAADCRVLVQSIEDPDRQAHIDCSCHLGRVKRLATAPDQPSLFWSAGEDGMVLQFDLREPHECTKKSTVFVMNYTTEFKCIAVNPTKPHLMAVGANDSYIRLYDRRFIKTSKLKEHEQYVNARKRSQPIPPDNYCVQYFAPGHLAKDNGGDQSFKLAATYVAFDSTGNDLLVNMGGEHVYLFDINNNRRISDMRIPECLPKYQKISSPPKDCCYERWFDDQPMNSHKYNYKLSRNPCACDYIDRARYMYRRKWIGDIYYSARDYLHVIRQWPEIDQAYIGLIQSLIALKWVDEATNWMQYFKSKFPMFASTGQVKELQYNIADLNEAPPNTEEMEVIPPPVSEQEKALRLNSCDYEKRYIGHCNTTTDIKEANFLGDNGDFICAGSDDGRIFIWDRKTTNLLTSMRSDVSIVNCVQPHPRICCIASSGIDTAVKIWTPLNKNDEEELKDHEKPWQVLEMNQDRMLMNPFEIMFSDIGNNLRSRPNFTAEEHIMTGVASCRTS